jgi:hypothetical protein
MQPPAPSYLVGSPNRISFHNVGNHRLFLLSEVHESVMKSPKIIHPRHRRRTKDEIAAVKVKQQKKAAHWVGGPRRI